MSARETFDKFVQRQHEQFAASKAFDYQAEKEDYLARLENLYVQIGGYLDVYVTAGTVRLERSTIKLNEEGIGPYDAPGVTVVIGGQQVSFTPVGTLLIGSKGRVDVVGSAGTARLALIDRQARTVRDILNVTVNIIRDGERLSDRVPVDHAKDIDWTWKIVSPPPLTAFIELDRESLLTMILEISGG